MDFQALSYIHHAINDLLQGKQAKLHPPADYEKHHEVVLPFKEDTQVRTGIRS